MIKSFHSRVPQVHASAFVEDSAQVIGDVKLGEEASIWFNAVIRADINPIHIGARSNVQDGTVIHVTHEQATTLEEEVTVGHNATLHGCLVRRGCLIGMGAVVLDDCQIGDHSLVAAGALITPGTIIPAASLVMGSPAKIKRPLTPEEVMSLDQYWKNYVGYLKMYREWAATA